MPIYHRQIRLSSIYILQKRKQPADLAIPRLACRLKNCRGPALPAIPSISRHRPGTLKTKQSSLTIAIFQRPVIRTAILVITVKPRFIISDRLDMPIQESDIHLAIVPEIGKQETKGLLEGLCIMGSIHNQK